MIRRKPVRERFGEVSFGRRKPQINTTEIRAEIKTMRSISALTNALKESTSNIDLEIDALLNGVKLGDDRNAPVRRPLGRPFKRWE